MILPINKRKTDSGSSPPGARAAGACGDRQKVHMRNCEDVVDEAIGSTLTNNGLV